MLVGQGALSFRTFAVEGKRSLAKHERILERLETFAFAGIETSEEGSVTGWVGPQHLFDGDFGSASIFRGPYAVFALRVDTRKVPGPLLKAHTALAIEAALEAEGLERLPARKKRELKLEVKHELLAELPPSQRAYGVFWNVAQRRVCLQSTSKAVIEHFRSLFERTFELSLEPNTPGTLAGKFAREHQRVDALKDARPLALGALVLDEDLAAV